MSCAECPILKINKTPLAYALRLVVGAVFMLSGLLKAMRTAAFADLMGQYGAEWLGYAAPVVVIIEMFLGMLLIFNTRPRLLSVLSVTFILAVSAIFLYGVVGRGVTDCGCFGPLTWLNTRPWITFVRNALIVALLVPSIFRQQRGEALTAGSFLCLAGATAAVMFMCGFTMHGAQCLRREPVPFEPIPLVEHPLSELVSCHPDSSYLVFAFSYSCPHCQNSIGNVNQYSTMGAVDRVIGLCVEDSVGRERFRRIFDVNFDIQEITKRQMYGIAHNSLPVSFFVRHDTVEAVIPGQVMTPALMIP